MTQSISELFKSLTSLGFSVMISSQPKIGNGRVLVDIYSPYTNKYISKFLYGRDIDIEQLLNDVAVEALKSMIKVG